MSPFLPNGQTDRMIKWTELFQDVFNSAAWAELDKKLKGDHVEFGEHKFCPKPRNVWKPFEFMDPDKVNCIVIGQDPYPETEQATGIAFGIPESIGMTLSLQNIINEIERGGECLASISLDWTLESWCMQGVLPINSSMTVMQGYHNSKCHLVWWQPVVSMLIDRIAYKNPGIPIIAMGAVARNTISHYARSLTAVIETSHPARAKHDGVGIVGSDCFVHANTVLTDPAYNLNRKPIKWHFDMRNQPEELVGTDEAPF